MLSFPHLVVLFLIALVVFGPEKLPELARMLGKATAEFRKMTNDFRYALEDEVREMDRNNRIKEQESALAAARAAQPPEPTATEPSAAPENTVAREIPSTVVTAPIEPPFAEPAPTEPPPVEPPSNGSAAAHSAMPQPPSEPVSVPHEKSPDDNAA